MTQIPTDLKYLIISYLPFEQIQKLGKSSRFFTTALYKFLLRNNYGLSQIDINRIYSKKLLPYDGFMKIITYLGYLTTEQHLYTNWYHCLIKAIQAKNYDLIYYYLFRAHGNRYTIPYDFIFHQAICTGELKIVALLRAYFGPYIVNILDPDEGHRHAQLSNNHKWYKNLMGFNKWPPSSPTRDIDDILSRDSLYSAHYLSLHINQLDGKYNLDFPTVLPRVRGDIIRKKLVTNMSKIIPMIQQFFAPSLNRSCYLFLAQILANAVTELPSDIDKIMELKDINVLIHEYTLSVCNGTVAKLLNLDLFSTRPYFSEVLYQPEAFIRYGKPTTIDCIWAYHIPVAAYDWVLPNCPLELLLTNSKNIRVYDAETLRRLYKYGKNYLIGVRATPASLITQKDLFKFIGKRQLSIPITLSENLMSEKEIIKEMKNYL